MLETLQNSSLILVALFAFVAAMTPGPNNIMLLSSGLTFGMRRTGPHMAGVAVGFFFLTTCIVLGLGAVIMAAPLARYALLVGGTLFMLYLAFKTITAPTDLKQREAKRPIRFWEAAAFQPINPKAWGFGVSYMALVMGAAPDGELTFWLAVFAIIVPQLTTAVSLFTWAGLGQAMSKLIDSPRTVRVINVVLGMTLFLMVPLMFWSELQSILAL